MAINISQHFKKEFWKRRVTEDAEVKPPTNAEHYIQPIITNGDRFQYLTQSDFMKEIEPSAHNINGRFQSTRPIKEVVEREVEYIGEDGKVAKKTVKDWVITGYDELETARYGYQKRFAFTKASHAAGDGFSINNEQLDKSEEAHIRFDTLNSYKDIAGLDMALMEVHLSCNQTGDAGLYQYVNASGEIEYKVYSFLDGYEIFPDIDEKGDPIYYILYSIKGKSVCDVHSTEYFDTWVQADIPDNETDTQNSWWEKVKGLFKVNDKVISEDKWRRVSHKERQIGAGIGQFSYFRLRDIPSGVAQLDIEAAERNTSFVLEGVKSATFDTLFVKATDIECLPPIGSHGSVIGVKGDVESLKASDAKRLAPSDISNVATVAQKELKESILHSTMSVIVDPDILRSGADSSSAMKLCFNDEVKYAMAMQPTFFKPLKHAVTVLKNLVAKVEKDPEYANLRVSITQNVWIPQNFAEAVDYITKLKYAEMISAENGRHELDLNYPDDMAIIAKEAEQKLYRQTFIPLQAKHDAQEKFGIDDVADDIVVAEPENPTKPGVDNNAKK
ncbi:MAG: phage portal protein [Muribaculaceae bacterium]|nr:phage portal protein [Muribaculaceae bacterium]